MMVHDTCRGKTFHSKALDVNERLCVAEVVQAPSSMLRCPKRWYQTGKKFWLLQQTPGHGVYCSVEGTYYWALARNDTSIAENLASNLIVYHP